MALLVECGPSRPDQLLDHFYAVPERRLWAQRARLVFELADEDETCRAIVERGADALAELTAMLARRLDLTTAPVVFAGGPIVHQALRQRLVRARLDELGVRDVRILGEDPVVGAARLAERLLAGRDA